MSLIKCPECGKEISNLANSCPYCGFPINDSFFDKEIQKINTGLQEVNADLQEINADIDNLTITYENLETAQGIINSLTETADIINNTVNPTEFFEGYDKMYYLLGKLESIPDIEYSQQPPDEVRRELMGKKKLAIQEMIGRYYKYIISKNYSVDIFYNSLSKYFSHMDDEHKDYINNLCKNGSKNQSDNAEKIRKFKNFYLNFAYIANRILLPPAKIVFIGWTLLWLLGTNSFFKDIPYILFGYIAFCGIANIIYISNKKRYLEYKMKIMQKKIKRLKKLAQQADPVAYQREYGDNRSQQTQKTNTVNYDYMNGHQFEYFCADVLKRNNFTDVEVTQGSGDHGIDILAKKDGITYAIQCKCYSSNIGNVAIQQAHTGKSLYHKDIAVVLTNRYFTPQAIEEANTLGVKLWDRDKLNALINTNNSLYR